MKTQKVVTDLRTGRQHRAGWVHAMASRSAMVRGDRAIRREIETTANLHRFLRRVYPAVRRVA